MNTNKLKTYAPKARLAFMHAVEKRAATLGLYQDRIADMTTDGDSAVIEGRIFTRQQGQQRSQLVRRIKALGTNNGKLVIKEGFNQFINEIAFTWFNRLTAIRFMEVNEYLDHGFRVLSKGEGAKFGEGFEILASAADVADDLGLNKEQIIDMVLDGNKEEELYRTILLGQCHQLSESMAFMFEKLDDATELLLPDNLTKTDSILKDLINDIPEDNWRDFDEGKGQIEVIGWLYQFYISDHKDAVIGKVVKREDIPAATQLFTPNWIVKYLVQNSLGRKWLATYPDSELKEKMEYYITPAEQSDDVIEQLKAITPTSVDPEAIKVLDPACGSGHILVEVYEVLREIYLERGYRLREIPELILTKNIYGLDIDDRAAQMAAFAVLMKAREDDKRIFSRITDSVGTENEIKLNIYSLQSTENLNINKLWADLDFDGIQQTGGISDLFAEPQQDVAETSPASADNLVYLNLLRYLKTQFTDAKNLGSLIEIDSKYQESLVALKAKLQDKATSSHQPTRLAVATLLPIFEQAIVLATKYDVAVANPPYMGLKGMNLTIKDFGKKNFPNSKSDLFAMFMENGFRVLKRGGFNAQVNMQSWMFLSSYKNFRAWLLSTHSVMTMAHLGARAFSQISGEVVQTTAWVCQNNFNLSYTPTFLRLVDGDELNKKQNLLLKNNKYTNLSHYDLQKIPDNPIAYWITSGLFDTFLKLKRIGEIAEVKGGMNTGNNDLFLRRWSEIDLSRIKFNCKSHEDTLLYDEKWFPYNKGGSWRKWYGNRDLIVNWKDKGKEIHAYNNKPMDYNGAPVRAKRFQFKEAITWSDIAIKSFAARYSPEGSLFDVKGSSGFTSDQHSKTLLALMCSPLIVKYMKLLNPSVTFQVGDISRVPFPSEKPISEELEINVERAISIAKEDWDSFEVSWDFKGSPLLNFNDKLLSSIFQKTYKMNSATIQELQSIENNNLKHLLSLYRLDSSECETVPVNEISLFVNPLYRYKTENPTATQQGEAIGEFISYSLGCIMGRYSLDREGLVYAHSGNNGFKELVADGAYNTFPADDDGIVPLADEDWVFEDDATTRFREFVKTVWGEEHLQENLGFVAESLCLDAIKPKKGESSIDTIRRYFSTQFYKDHLKTYKKRPIYWLFSSGKAKAFECLVYLHRYNEGTLSRMRTEYVTPLMGKLESRKNILEDSKATASGAELRAIDKELKIIDKKQAELVTFDEELKHLAEMKISLDLDDGVKVNYGKFGNLLADVKAIHGTNPEVI
ncbi:BREX-1 system adenine-specific DNA-methyltransferase PglX [Shewanella sp. 10N.286.45.A1]|uniref:BREX-1 system adenine-specific DNA-methyltransferase PglX n=1 Tax=Shewanella sp. 10N.286.45.A1 TaxID=3229694 RepID=UPI00354C958A